MLRSHVEILWVYFFSFFSAEIIHTLAYEKPQPKYSAEAIFKLLLDPKIDRCRVYCSWPIADITSSSSFVIDVTRLKHPDDVRKDFFGKWIYSGSHPFAFKASMSGNVVDVERCAPGATGSVFYLRRLYAYHPSNPNFRRMLAFVSGSCYL